jgi:hypothetical protein
MCKLALMLLLIVFAAPAFAACDDGTLPTSVTYDDGSTATVIERTADFIHTRQVSGRFVEETILHAGIFEIREERFGARYDFTYATDFPSPAQLVPGARFLLKRTQTYSPFPHFVEVEVVAEDTIEVGGCTYPVLEVTRRPDYQLTPQTFFVHMPSMLTLRHVMTADGSGITYTTTAIAIE